MRAWLVGLVARLPVTVHAKLLTAFLGIVLLLIIVGAVSLQTLSAMNRRAEDLVQLQRKMAAYRQLQTTRRASSTASPPRSSYPMTRLLTPRCVS
jgi:hypothetical protein